MRFHSESFFFFFTDTATTEIYTLSLHDALPIWRRLTAGQVSMNPPARQTGEPIERLFPYRLVTILRRSEEHTSELQSQSNLVCRLLLEKKKKKTTHLSYVRDKNIKQNSFLTLTH